MEPLTWTGTVGEFLDPVTNVLAVLFALAVVTQIVLSVVSSGDRIVTNPDGTASSAGGAYGMVSLATRGLGVGLIVLALLYIVIGAVAGPGAVGIIGGMSQQLVPVWVALVVTFIVSIKIQAQAGSLRQTL